MAQRRVTEATEARIRAALSTLDLVSHVMDSALESAELATFEDIPVTGRAKGRETAYLMDDCAMGALFEALAEIDGARGKLREATAAF